MNEALIGRDREAAAVADAIADPDCSALVLRGPAGVGKTALARAALIAAEAQGALIGSGKYAQGEVQSPFAPIMAALSELVGRALDRLSDPEPVAAAMAQALGPALGVLVQSGFRAAAPPMNGAASEDAARTLIGRREAATHRRGGSCDGWPLSRRRWSCSSTTGGVAARRRPPSSPCWRPRWASPASP